ERDTIKLRLDSRFFQQLMQNTSWDLNAESPFERTRILDPAADRKILDKGFARFKA
ncbi:MAG TPA: D-amino-acid oxidase, partial [Rhodospirillaceae bacterium]|nr:D-amino-acid oxidase [Rhodospirillaceae bacterium]